MGELELLKKKHPVVGQITGKGLLIGIEYVQDRETHEPFPTDLAFAKKVDLACRKRGLVTRPSTNVQVLAPPFIITKEQLNTLVAILDEAIADATLEFAPELSN